MVWTKLDDHFWANPKIAGVSDRAYRLYVNGLNWSVANLTDGMIPDHMLTFFTPRNDEASARNAVDELQKAQLWHQVPAGFKINDYDEFQPSKSEVKARRESFSERGVKGVHVRWHSKKPDPDCSYCQDALASGRRETSSDSNSHTKGDSGKDYPRPDPTRPVKQQQDAAFQNFNLKRAEWAVERKRQSGIEVKSPGGLARTIAADPEHITESVRQWAHKDCTECGGSGFVTFYSGGSGGVKKECDAV